MSSPKDYIYMTIFLYIVRELLPQHKRAKITEVRFKNKIPPALAFIEKQEDEFENVGRT